MVAMNADPASMRELLGPPEQDLYDQEGSALHLVPTPAEQVALGMAPSEIAMRGFSQDIYAHLVKECFDAESRRPEERDHDEVQRLVNIKDGWLEMLDSLEEKQDAVLAAYSFHIGEPYAQEQKVA